MSRFVDSLREVFGGPGEGRTEVIDVTPVTRDTDCEDATGEDDCPVVDLAPVLGRLEDVLLEGGWEVLGDGAHSVTRWEESDDDPDTFDAVEHKFDSEDPPIVVVRDEFIIIHHPRIKLTDLGIED